MKSFKQFLEESSKVFTKLSFSKLKEDAPANSVGGGNIAGLGVGPQGEPGIKKKKRKGQKWYGNSFNTK
jgi:hypothetical protein